MEKVGTGRLAGIPRGPRERKEVHKMREMGKRETLMGMKRDG